MRRHQPIRRFLAWAALSVAGLGFVAMAVSSRVFALLELRHATLCRYHSFSVRNGALILRFGDDSWLSTTEHWCPGWTWEYGPIASSQRKLIWTPGFGPVYAAPSPDWQATLPIWCIAVAAIGVRAYVRPRRCRGGCRVCGYPTTGLRESVCSECGTPIAQTRGVPSSAFRSGKAPPP